jgi:hypothetical protein
MIFASASYPVGLLDYPHPYSALLALSSDLDDTPCWEDYFQLIDFLNAPDSARPCAGFALEFANSIYFRAHKGSLDYLNAAPRVRERLRALVHSGHIDTIHSMGDGVCDRREIRLILDEMADEGCVFPVWTDHAQAPTNLGDYQTRGQGCRPGRPAYCSDLLEAFGVNYVWRGQVTGLIGQERSALHFRSLAGRWQKPGHMLSAAKEISKVTLSALGNSRYSMHFPNRVLQPLHLADGSRFFEVLRCNAFPGGIPDGDSANAIPDVLSPHVLNALIAKRGVMIVYTHLGRRMPRRDERSSEAIHEAFAHLEYRQSSGEVLVLSTARLLDYLAVREASKASIGVSGDCVKIDVIVQRTNRVVRSAVERRGVAGLSVIVPTRANVTMTVDGREIRDVEVCRIGDGSKMAVCVPLRRLGAPP